MNEHGILYRTIAPTSTGCRVVVVDRKKLSHRSIEGLAAALNVRARFVSGKSLLLGADDRAEARRQFLAEVR